MPETWSFDPDAVAALGEAEQAYSFSFVLEPEHWQALSTCGTWWVLPLGHRRGDVIGIRVVPNRALADCPVVQLSEHQALTLVSRPEHLVPYLLFPGTILQREHWDRLLTLPPPVWEALRAAHRALGGKDDLDAIRQVLTDGRLRDAGLIEDRSDESRERRREIRTRIDPTDETRAFFEYLFAAVERYDAPVPIPALGGWRAAAASVCLSAANMNLDNLEARGPEAAWELLRQPAGLDCFQGRTPSMTMAPTGDSDQLVHAAHLLVERADGLPEAWRGDPWWPAVTALAAAGDDYDGVAHMDAAGALQQEGRAAEAFAALTTSAYWMYVQTQEAFPSLRETTAALAADSGWAETSRALAAIAEGIERAGA
jgi:hypothetical protein